MIMVQISHLQTIKLKLLSPKMEEAQYTAPSLHRSCSYPLDCAPLLDPRFTMAFLPDHQSSPVKGCSFSLIAFLTHYQPSTAGCDESVHVSGEVNRKNFAAPLRNDGKQTRYCPLQTRST
ncbi:unnamed protein product [Brassica rapa subsp. narinosa]